jgi:hypothetical protein
MLRRRSGFSAAVLLAGGLLTATPAAFAKPIDHSPQGAAHKFLGPVWEALASLFGPPVHAAATACHDLGSIMDPNGCPRSQASPDLGSIMDPDG